MNEDDRCVEYHSLKPIHVSAPPHIALSLPISTPRISRFRAQNATPRKRNKKISFSQYFTKRESVCGRERGGRNIKTTNSLSTDFFPVSHRLTPRDR
ncbi:hypothetical protein SERLA73DRAFT_180104 [Serpula lacrymans var. lacrymans S7.3]|uniref:Uncharacterized protein n=2 Tax=Serpula lacrymans var. lacrymans TaxID=341189 RepID=F8PVZ8_SERL3|nr:uncharacterized protein SERLADRAFT_465561 [Serpula lacrymans var. lacrymans S7.9]EGN99857.1 hypothetical protein SERLA73DRAFT_180104 [Serpula lacrymans var. lacrymans S7.3]EGO25426.1 hypothetical protein SERLADRAFT_465561 [Serpula lacrymans var. lacrymans S7.9]